MQDYKNLITYNLSKIAFILTWEFVPVYYYHVEDARQRDQMKQAARSDKQNIVEGSEERSLSSKLMLYCVARASMSELLEDYEDILDLEGLPKWDKTDPRFYKIRGVFESPSPSGPSSPSCPSCASVVQVILGTRRNRGTRGTRQTMGVGTRGTRWTRSEVDIIVNYIIDVLIRGNYLLDQQINAVEKKHQIEGGYKENLLKKRLEYRRGQRDKKV
jgi:four helix bundle suffix protein